VRKAATGDYITILGIISGDHVPALTYAAAVGSPMNLSH
jgi:hypothetical protein